MNIRRNNFDLLRLFAALQVVFGHSLAHLQINSIVMQKIGLFLSAFPGVPIFFIISGFLITASYERNHDIKQYIVNRALRIYPALWVAFIVSIIIINSLSYLHLKNITDFLVWSFCQVSMFQFYNPSFLRGFGVGVVNGSLWTIAVELQFYIIVPVLYSVLKSRKNLNQQVKFFWVVFVIAILISILCRQLSSAHMFWVSINPIPPILGKLLYCTLLPYLYCFVMGILFRLHLDMIQKFLVGKYKFMTFFLFYFTLYLFFRESISFSLSNPIIMILLAIPVMSFAFNFTHLSAILLKGNDFSYGVYLYHMLIVNVFVCLGFMGAWYFLPLVVMLTLIFSSLSWFCIEQPTLVYKCNPLKTIAHNESIGALHDKWPILGSNLGK